MLLTCEICEAIRDIDELSVVSIDLSAVFDLAPWSTCRNVSHCGDSEPCRAGALRMAYKTLLHLAHARFGPSIGLV